MRYVILIVTLAVACGDSAAGQLVIDLRTDYGPGTEFDGVIVEVEGSGSTMRDEAIVDPEGNYVAGVRIASFDVRRGELRVVVSLVLDGVVRIRHPITVAHPGGNFGLVALITRNCEGVSCMDPNASQCLDGRCVDERCAPTTPEFCPPPVCDEASACAPSFDCARAECIDGVCGEILDDSMCGDAEVCTRGIGCVPEDGGDCASSLDCALFEMSCRESLGRRCAAIGIGDDSVYQAALFDPDTGEVCAAPTSAMRRGTSGNWQLFRGNAIIASGCNVLSISLDTGAGVTTPAPCGLPTLLDEDTLAWIEDTDEPGGQVVHLPGGEDLAFMLPSNPSSLWSVAPGEVAFQQPEGNWQLMEVSSAMLTEVITEPEFSLGLARDRTTGGFVWIVGETNMLEVVHTDATNAETLRVPVQPLPPLLVDANYVSAGCAL